MSTRPEILEPARRIGDPPGDAAVRELERRGRVPVLPGHGARDEEGDQGEESGDTGHREAISRTARTAATLAALAIAATACEDVLAPTEQLTLGELLVLPLQSGAPTPPTVSRFIRADDPVTQVISLQHNDMFLSLYAEVRFPAGSLTGIAAGDSVRVTVQPRSGGYGVTVSAPGAAFASANPPTVRFAYGRYGDFSIVEESPTYEGPTAYAAALDVWEEATLDRWSVAGGSGSAGTDAVSARLDAPGTVLVAAPR